MTAQAPEAANKTLVTQRMKRYGMRHFGIAGDTPDRLSTFRALKEMPLAIRAL